MKKNMTHNVKSDIIENLVQNGNIDQVGARQTTNATSKFFRNLNNQGDNKVMIIAFLAIILVIVILIFAIVKSNSNKKDTKENKSLYDIAYETMGFKENSKLKKLYCSKKTTNEEDEVQEEEIRIYYFDGDEVDTVIYHNDINLSDDYMDYYDTMYDEYDKSLANDYKYDNVDTNITKGENRLLITVIAYNKREGEKKLGVPKFVNYEDAKKTTIDSGYNCK